MGRRIAVIIGVDVCGKDLSVGRLDYAEDDARAIHDTLTDPIIGTFDPADVHLLIGDAAEAKNVKGLLHKIAVESRSTDILLIYFAGHTLRAKGNGVIDDYLVTPDLSDETLRERPYDALRMAFLRVDVIEKFQGESFLILDCCRAGSYLDPAAEQVQLMPVGGRRPNHSVLMACPVEGVARESDELRHGVVTKHILDGLTGQAADSEGLVTFGRLADYVVRQDIDPKPGQAVQSWGATALLTRPGERVAGVGVTVPDPLPAHVSIRPLENPLERSAAAIGDLLSEFFPRNDRWTPSSAANVFGPSSGASGWGGQEKAELFRTVLKAEAAAVLEYTSTGYQPISATHSFREADHLLRRMDPAALPRQQVSFGHVIHEGPSKRLLCVPLRQASQTTLVLVVVNPAEQVLGIGEPLAKMLAALWGSDFHGRGQEAEMAVLTALRADFRRLPHRLYDRAFALYRELLSSLSMVFQPIVTIDKVPRQVYIHSYEALARLHPDAQGAPSALLNLAHVWGDQFVIERDEVILRKAINSYHLAHDQCFGSGTGRPRPISVNVAVRSLLNDAYLDVVERAIAATDLHPRAVTLEISEQDPIEPRSHEQWDDEGPLAFFHQRLVDIRKRLGVKFAVDDFGVGHSSVSRVAELPLTQIKVDRAILRHGEALAELRTVVTVARHAVRKGLSDSSRTVIVEGVEEGSPVTLSDIYGCGIRHVQGFITGERPAPAIKRDLSLEKREHIAALVRGDHERSGVADARDGHSGRGDSAGRSA